MKSSEIENIRKSLDIFVEGLNQLDYHKISVIFFEKGLSCGALKGEISYAFRDHWKDMAEQAKKEDTEPTIGSYTIKSLNIIGNAASVIIDLIFRTEDKITERYIDFYHMLKVNDTWRIVNKIYPTNVEIVSVKDQ